MNAKNTIITSRCLDLKNRFIEIKNKIETDSKYTNLKTICEFLPSKNLLIYDTERIYPDASEYKDRTPILFLFSNPHPVSVKTGLFLSEPRSKNFWLRLFQSEYLGLPNVEVDLARWNNSTPKVLGDMMLEGKYKSDFLIYFHCLYPIPTNQLQDLYSLFGKRTDLWNQIEKDSIKELSDLLREETINHVIVFTNPIFQLLTDISNKSMKNWRKKVINAIETNTEKLWSQKESGKANAKHKVNFTENVYFYHALDTHAKDWGKGNDKRFFTSALDKIFGNILKVE